MGISSGEFASWIAMKLGVSDELMLGFGLWVFAKEVAYGSTNGFMLRL